MSEKWTTDDIPEQSGRVVVITGANSGLGKAAAAALAEKEATVIMACRSEERGEEAAADIRRTTPHAALEIIQLDLAALESVRRFADEVLSRYDRLDLLINNAGIMAIPYRETADGLEMQFGVNHLGHFALTARLLPLLRQSSGARVVNVSSGAHKIGTLDLETISTDEGYSKWRAYGRSKLANLLFTYELQRRLEASGESVISVAAHPGYSATNLQVAGPRMEGRRLGEWLMERANRLLGQSAEMGALPLLFAATSPEVRGGDYMGPDGFMEMRGHPTPVDASERAKDHAAAQRLWERSEELADLRYHLPTSA